MIRGESLGKLMDALRQAQLDFDPVLKDTRNPLYNSKYADLSGVITATQPALAKHGLVISQLAISDLEHHGAGVATLLVHPESGEFLGSEFLLPATGHGKGDSLRYDAQTAGGAVTYARRYAYLAIIGVAAEDDDGNRASGAEKPARQTNEFPEPRSAPQPVTAPTTQKTPVTPIPAPKAGTEAPTAIPAGPVAPPPTAIAPVAGTDIPTEDELTAYRAKFSKLGLDLAEKGGLKAGRGLPINRKLLKFLLSITGATAATELTKAAWADFFSRADHVVGLENGWFGLAGLVNNANGIKDDEKN